MVCIGLTDKEKEQAKKWRIQKCGHDSFGMLFLKFEIEVNNAFC